MYVTQNCETCGGQFRTHGSQTKRGRGKYCSRRCYYDSQRRIRKESLARRMRKAKGHPIAPPSGTVAVARLVLYDKIGPGRHPCHWCGDPIEWLTGQSQPGAIFADHVDFDPANDDPSNLVPSCNVCNAHRQQSGKRALIAGDEPIVYVNGRRRRAVGRTCEYCGEAFLAPASVLLPTQNGKGRFCSRSCARRRPRKRAVKA